MAANPLIFKDSEKVRDAITKSQKKEIANLYTKWADELNEKAKYYKHKTTSSSWVKERQIRILQQQLRETSQQISNEIAGIIENNMYIISDAVVKDAINFANYLGFTGSAAYSYVPDQVVRNIVTGNVYEGGWNLSSRIWSSNEQTLKDIYGVVAQGVAENSSIYDISKALESYVRPESSKGWNPLIRMKNTQTGEYEYKRIYKKQVDYNAQRLARTLVQHTYQQSFVATTKDNPFILKYQWLANGSRVCEICADRDGRYFEKDDLPLDHPNGMCTMIPVEDSNIEDRLANWVNSEDGTYPEIDDFALNFGYISDIKNKLKK